VQRKANIEALRSALSQASSPEQRTQAIIAFQKRNTDIRKQLTPALKSQAAASTPSQQFLNSLPAKRKAAIEQRLALSKQLRQITAPDSGMTTEQRSSALIAWRKSYAKARDQFRVSLPAATNAAESSAAAETFSKTLPPDLQKARADMAQIATDRKTLMASTAGMTPEQRVAAWRQWAITVGSKLKAYHDQLKAASTATSLQSTTAP